MTTSRLFAAEFVFPGHPDKISDAIADALVLEASRRERRALVGVEVAVHRNRVFITGRIACKDAAGINVDRIVRETYRSAGYGEGWYPTPEDVIVESHLCLGSLEEGEAEFRNLSDDQAICIGYANSLAATNYQPVEQWLVRRLARRLHALRMEAPDLALGPDGKALVVVREEDASWALEAFSCSLQQRAAADDVALHRAVRLALADEMEKLRTVLPGLSAELPQQLTVNGAGAFDVGGPEGDNGLSGKKLVMDAYGPRVAIGGGAWSGKDFFKADRAGGIHARRLAKLVVRLGLATEASVTLHWSPGDCEARVLHIETPSGQPVAVRHVANCVDLTLERSGELFQVDDLVEVARWGHFANAVYPWETLGLL
jgi:S-adenosylmethionine synthetase